MGAGPGPAAALGASESSVLQLWRRQYPSPDESGGAEAKPQVEHLYRPPASDLKGVSIACTIIAAWAVLLYHALFQVVLPGSPKTRAPGAPPPASLPHIALLFLALEFVYTGLFITTHDAMHGTIAYRNRSLNDALGWAAISAYAWFDYDMLHTNHWRHHNHTGVPHQDPDFHGGNPHMLVWFARFMREYSTLGQFLRIGCWGNALLLLGAHYPNLLLFMTLAPLCSAFRLFYYGTYVPHRPPLGHAGHMPWHVSRTSAAPRLQSFLTCYHFDLHWEHHRWPYAPWWQLPACRDLAGRIGASPAPLPTAVSGTARDVPAAATAAVVDAAAAAGAVKAECSSGGTLEGLCVSRGSISRSGGLQH